MTRLTRYLNPPVIKHLRIREDSEPFDIIRYHGYCGAVGTASRDYPKEATKVTCQDCLRKLQKGLK